MRPRIGITCGLSGEGRPAFTVKEAYVRAVFTAGGLPILLPPVGDGLTLEPPVEAWLEGLDGLLLPGGGDVDPVFFGEEPRPGLGDVEPERDVLELALVQAALAAGLPILGVCRGCQVLNIAAGGSVYQDLPGELPGVLKHRQAAPMWYPTHLVQVEPGSRLAQLLGVTELRVNTSHHQAVKRVAPGWVVTARAADGVVEGIELPKHPFALGVQWHPEAMVERDPVQRRLFAALVEAAAVRRQRA